MWRSLKNLRSSLLSSPSVLMQKWNHFDQQFSFTIHRLWFVRFSFPLSSLSFSSWCWVPTLPSSVCTTCTPGNVGTLVVYVICAYHAHSPYISGIWPHSVWKHSCKIRAVKMLHKHSQRPHSLKKMSLSWYVHRQDSKPLLYYDVR